jgi:hypothetical protein
MTLLIVVYELLCSAWVSFLNLCVDWSMLTSGMFVGDFWWLTRCDFDSRRLERSLLDG